MRSGRRHLRIQAVLEPLPASLRRARRWRVVQQRAGDNWRDRPLRHRRAKPPQVSVCHPSALNGRAGRPDTPRCRFRAGQDRPVRKARQRATREALRSVASRRTGRKVARVKPKLERLLVESRHDLFLEEIERVDHFVVVEIADVEHTHEVVGADLLHLILDLLGDAVGIAGDQIAGFD